MSMGTRWRPRGSRITLMPDLLEVTLVRIARAARQCHCAGHDGEDEKSWSQRCQVGRLVPGPSRERPLFGTASSALATLALLSLSVVAQSLKACRRLCCC